MIRKITDGTWRAFATVPDAPPKLNALLIQCLEVEPQARPSFEQVLSELSGPIKDEIDQSNFSREPIGSYDASSLHDASENSGSVVDSDNSHDDIKSGTLPVDQLGAENDAKAEYMRNPMLSSGARGSEESRLSQRLSRVEVVTQTEV